MRDFVYFSGRAWTTGNFTDLMKAGRMDIAIHFIINSMFISHKLRDDVRVHLVFYGPNDPPKHIIIEPRKKIPETGKDVGSLDISKKDMAGLIKRILFKYKKDKKIEAFPGCFVEKKNLGKVLDELEKEGKAIYVLDEKGDDVRKVEFKKDVVMVVGDHIGFPKKELRRLRQTYHTISLGKTVYFASQVATILNYELDKK